MGTKNAAARRSRVKALAMKPTMASSMRPIMPSAMPITCSEKNFGDRKLRISCAPQKRAGQLSQPDRVTRQPEGRLWRAHPYRKPSQNEQSALRISLKQLPCEIQYLKQLFCVLCLLSATD